MNLNPFRSDAKTDDAGFMYTEQQLMARLKFFIGICLALTLVGIVFVVLYSIIFVTQPLNAMSPIDAKFFELIIPIATFLTGTLSGIMLAGKDDKETKLKALEAATRPVTSGATPSPFAAPSRPFGAPSMGSVVPPPPGGMMPSPPPQSGPPAPPNLPPPPVF